MRRWPVLLAVLRIEALPVVAGLWAKRHSSPPSRTVSSRRVDLDRPAAWSRPRPSASPPSQPVPPRLVHKCVHKSASRPAGPCRPAWPPDLAHNGHGSIRSVDQWRMSGRCAGIRIRWSASCPQSGIDAMVRYRPVSPWESCERVSLGSPEPVTYSASVLGVTPCRMHLRLAAPPPTGRDEDGPQGGAHDVAHDEADRAEATQ